MDDTDSSLKPRKLGRSAQLVPTFHITTVAGPLQEKTHYGSETHVMSLAASQPAVSGPTASSGTCASPQQLPSANAVQQATVWVPTPVPRLVAVLKASQARCHPSAASVKLHGPASACTAVTCSQLSVHISCCQSGARAAADWSQAHTVSGRTAPVDPFAESTVVCDAGIHGCDNWEVAAWFLYRCCCKTGTQQ